MFTLYQPSAAFGLPNASPYCLKLEAFLRWQNIPFESKPGLPFQGPFKKVPYADYNGERLGDSSNIIDKLMADRFIGYPKHLDLGQGLAFQRMMEEHVYWSIVYFRWTDNTIWPALKKTFFDPVPALIRPFVVASARKQARRALYGQGLGRLPTEAVIERVGNDLNALAQHVDSQSFVCGDTMTHFDIAIWAVLSQIMQCNLELPISNVAKKYESLVAYVERVNKVLKPLWGKEGEPAELSFEWVGVAAS